MSTTPSITQLLVEFRNGNQDVMNQIWPLVYDELRRLAGRYLQAERPDHTLQPTALVHEAYLRLVEYEGGGVQDRAHFFRIAAQVMRHILVDHARGQVRQKRDGGPLSPLDDCLPVSVEKPAEVVALDEALTALAAFDPRKSWIVELRYFGGLTVEETAEVVGVSTPTIKREWSLARAWLQRELEKK
ncbi:MAG: sigma-70 family RNA polymerase sigma factor [Blastocatellia bacterium]|nr:sigma-70 family RNA polymerase sigma factor [Blastocatellia bacterium]